MHATQVLNLADCLNDIFQIRSTQILNRLNFSETNFTSYGAYVLGLFCLNLTDDFF
jgi:hypothetical protein